MEIVIHWSNPHNFVNKEMGLSSKHRIGHKPNTMTQTTRITVNRKRLDLRFKKEISKKLDKVSHLLKHNTKAKVFIEGSLFMLNVPQENDNKETLISCRSHIKFANTLTNILIKMNKAKENNDINTFINKKQTQLL